MKARRDHVIHLLVLFLALHHVLLVYRHCVGDVNRSQASPTRGSFSSEPGTAATRARRQWWRAGRVDSRDPGKWARQQISIRNGTAGTVASFTDS